MHRVALVTGSTSGLGAALSRSLLAADFKVVGVARRASAHSFGNGYRHVMGSVADPKVVDTAFRTSGEVGRLALVLNCAGQGVFGPVGAYTVDEMQAALEGNLLGLMAFTDRAVAEMRVHGGDIVNVMSSAAKKLRIEESVYTAAKWGAKAYTRCVRESVRTQKLPIRIFEAYPCGMNTAFWSEAVRPLTDGSSFPAPDSIASSILAAVLSTQDAYVHELLFERR